MRQCHPNFSIFAESRAAGAEFFDVQITQDNLCADFFGYFLGLCLVHAYLFGLALSCMVHKYPPLP
jgi:hypothetical protein